MSKAEQSPMVTLRNALRDAANGVDPSLTAEGFLADIGLDSDQPDGRKLMPRLLGSGATLGSLRAFVHVRTGVRELVRKTNERTANPHEESLAQLLGQVVIRQLTREGDDCPMARQVAVTSLRDDIIPPDLRTALGGLTTPSPTAHPEGTLAPETEANISSTIPE